VFTEVANPQFVKYALMQKIEAVTVLMLKIPSVVLLCHIGYTLKCHGIFTFFITPLVCSSCHSYLFNAVLSFRTATFFFNCLTLQITYW